MVRMRILQEVAVRHFLVLVSILSFAACGAVDDQPLGGPNGGTTDPTDPNGGQNGDTNTDNTDDAGTTTTTTDDSGTTSQKDSGTTTKDASVTVDSGGSTSVTWTSIFNNYMASSKEGRCASCHSQGSTATKLYSWLSGKGYISGTKSTLVSSSKSCLSWYSGNMPPSGPSDAKAVSDMNAWAASGAPNN